MNNINSKQRLKRATRLVNQILRGYVWLFLLQKILGRRYYEKRIHALHEKNALKVKELILDLKGLFTKVGQLLSVMSNVLPEAYAEILESLQDHAPPTSFSNTRTTIEKELGEPIEQLFDSFDEEPIASASIGQVYKAKLKTGETVAVKVQHKDIEELAAMDLDIIEKLVKRISFFLRINGIDHVYKQVRIMVEEELDYTREAQSMVEIGKNLTEFPDIIVPKLYSAYSSAKIITCSFHHGVKITQTEKLKAWNINPQELSERLVTAFCKMILEDGFYHADPHPGNVLVNENGEIILLDFGATAELNETMRKEIPVIIQHIIRKDTPKIIRSLQKMGFLGNDASSKEVATKLVEALTEFVQNEIKIDNLNLKNVSFEDIRGSSLDKLRQEISIKSLTSTMQVPKDWILLERAIILIHGISISIAPDFNPMDTVKPYLKKVVLSNGGLKTLVVDTIKQQLAALVQLPSELNQFLTRANNGDLEVKVQNKDARKFYALGHQLMLVLVILTLFTVEKITPGDASTWSWIAGIAAGILLIWSIWKNKQR